MAVAKSNEKREYASIVFLQWFTQAEQNVSYSIQSNYLPVTKEASSYEAIEKLLPSLSADVPEISRETIKAALDQVNNSTLYTSRGFKQGEAARNILETTMPQLAYYDREEILSQIASGASQEEALKPYLSEEHFKEWFQDLEQQLKNVCQ